MAVSAKGYDMAIDDETRARAMAAVRRRMAGEASDEDMEAALGRMSSTPARRAVAKAATPEVIPRSKGAAPDTYGVPSLTPNAGAKSESELSANERFDRATRNIARSFPGSSPMASLDAVVGPTAGGLARNAGRFLGGLGSSGIAGFKSGRAEAAATKAAAESASRKSQPAQNAAVSAMESEGGRSITPKMPPKPLNKKPARDVDDMRNADDGNPNYHRKGGKVKAYAKGGMISSASRRGDGIATKGKTRGRMC